MSAYTILVGYPNEVSCAICQTTNGALTKIIFRFIQDLLSRLSTAHESIRSDMEAIHGRMVAVERVIQTVTKEGENTTEGSRVSSHHSR